MSVTPGDTNLDGSVNFSDFLALSANYRQAGGWAEGDSDGDGVVQFNDFLVLSENYGGPLAANAASVPEPSSFLLFGWLVCLAQLRKQHHRR